MISLTLLTYYAKDVPQCFISFSIFINILLLNQIYRHSLA